MKKFALLPMLLLPETAASSGVQAAAGFAPQIRKNAIDTHREAPGRIRKRKSSYR